MALGWLYLYSKYRRAKRELREIEAAEDAANEICVDCGNPRYKHADNQEETCPTYFGLDNNEEN